MQDSKPQDIILKHLNEPEDLQLAQKVSILRNSSIENENHYQEIKEIWEKSVQTARLIPIDAQVSVKSFRNRLNERMDTSAKSFGWIKNAAAGFIILGLGLWLYSEKTTPHYLVKETANRIDSVTLSDETKVILAKHSSIKYPEKFEAQEREVQLIKGQAFFKVSHDERHPFNVMIRQSKVKVLGTSFNINYTHTAINVSVKTGVVRFSPDGKLEPAVLTAGHAASYNYLQHNITFPNHLNSSSWLTKELKFVDLPLDKVCAELSEYYGVNIILYDKMQTTKMFNATFTNSSLDEVLTVLKATYQIKVNQKDSLIIIKNIHN